MDPFSAVFLAYSLAKFGLRYAAGAKKILAYKTAFERTSTLVFSVQSLRAHLFNHLHLALRERADRELQRARSALEDARPLVYSKRMLRQPGSLEASMQLLDQCHETLLAILPELVQSAQLDRRYPRPQPEKYFQELRSRMF